MVPQDAVAMLPRTKSVFIICIETSDAYRDIDGDCHIPKFPFRDSASLFMVAYFMLLIRKYLYVILK
jgi:hypothetical protein